MAGDVASGALVAGDVASVHQAKLHLWCSMVA